MLHQARTISTESALQARLKHSSILAAGVGAALILTPLSALALPTGGSVAAGGFTNFNGNPSGNATTITQTTNRGVLDWSTFNVGNKQSVTFAQPDAKSITLNRVNGQANPSEILGNLKANGNIVISNPNGVVFGPHSQTDVAGLIATTAGTSNANFMNGQKLVFDQTGNPSGLIDVKTGATIRTVADKGLIALVAPEVKNAGLIAANKGTVVLAGAETASFDIYGDGLVGFASSAGSKGLVDTSGHVSANGGQVILTAAAASNIVDGVVSGSGIKEADSISNGVLVSGGRVDANGLNNGDKGGSVLISAPNVKISNGAIVGAGGGTTNPGNPIPGDLGDGGTVTVKATNTAILGKGSKLYAGGKNGGAVSFTGNNILLNGGISAKAVGGTAGSASVSGTEVTVNKGGTSGYANQVSEKFVEAQSQEGTNVTVNGVSKLTVEDMADSEITGGTGDITLSTGDKGRLAFNAEGDTIRTTSGNVNLLAGTGGMRAGSVRTGLDTPGVGTLHAGNITVRSKSDATIRDLNAVGTVGQTKVDVESGGSLLLHEVGVRVTKGTATDANRALVDLDAHKDLTVTNGITAIASNTTGQRGSKARIEAISHTGDATFGAAMLAKSDSGFDAANPAGSSSDSSITLSANTVTAERLEANSKGGNRSFAGVTINADKEYNAKFDNLALAEKSAGGTDKTEGYLTVNAPVSNVQVPDALGNWEATTDVKVNGKINVATPEDAVLTGPVPVEMVDANRNFRLKGGNSVTVTGDINSPLSDVEAVSGAGGIQLANVTTGDAARVDSLTLYTGRNSGGSAFGAFNPGSQKYTTTGGGNINTGNLKLDGTFGDGKIVADSSGNLTTGNINARVEDRPNRGSAGLTDVSLTATNDILVNGDINAISIGTQGATQNADANVALTAGNALTVKGDVVSSATGGFRGLQAKDVGESRAMGIFKAKTIDLNDVTVDAIGGNNATTYLLTAAPQGSVAVGNLLARSYTSGHGPAAPSTSGVPASGHANATVEIITKGTLPQIGDPYPTDITYKANDPRSEANAASRQGRFTDAQTVDGDTARLIIVPLVSAPQPPVPPVNPPSNPGGGGNNPPPVAPPANNGGGTPPVTPATPAPLVDADQFDVDRTDTINTALYSYYGETTGDLFYYGNTDVNITLLGAPQAAQASVIPAGGSLANLAPAAGPGMMGQPAPLAGQGKLVGAGTRSTAALDTETNGPIKRKVGGSDAKRARYIWPKFTGDVSAEYAANTSLEAPRPTPRQAANTIGSLAELAPAAGGIASSSAALAKLDPAAGNGGQGSCGNNYLDDGYATQFNTTDCRREEFAQ